MSKIIYKIFVYNKRSEYGFFKKINSIYQKNQNIEIYIDMDGTIVEFLFDNDNSFMKRGKYLKKRPIMPILNIIEIIKEKYPLIVFKILSCSSTNQMKKEKNAWIDKYIPYICKKIELFFQRKMEIILMKPLIL